MRKRMAEQVTLVRLAGRIIRDGFDGRTFGIYDDGSRACCFSGHLAQIGGNSPINLRGKHYAVMTRLDRAVDEESAMPTRPGAIAERWAVRNFQGPILQARTRNRREACVLVAKALVRT